MHIIFATFQHSFLQLKCTWSSVSPKLELRCGTNADLALSASHLPCRCFPLKTTPFACGIWTPSNKLVPWVNHSPHPNGILIGSAVFAELKTVAGRPKNRQTDRQTDGPRCNNRPHLHLHSSEMRPNNKLCNIAATYGTNRSNR